MSKPAVFTIPVLSFRNLETPLQANYRDYYAVVDTRVLPDLSEWRNINVRDAKLTGFVPNRIREGFKDSPDMFVFLNRGLVLAVQKVTFDNKTSTVNVTLSDPELHGLLDGGHTYNIVRAEADPSKARYMRIEFLEGFDHDEITAIVEARNTSNQVRKQSLMNLAKRFDELKDALQGSPYFDLIAFKEFAFDNDGNPLPIDVRDIVALLTLFDRDHFNETNHPVVAYNSKAACLKHFEDNPDSYRKIFPLAKDILPLYDHIRARLPYLYNTARGQSGDVSGGKYGRLTGVTYRDGKTVEKLYYIRQESKYGTPDGFTYPVLAAFRAMLEQKKGRYVWASDLVPLNMLDGDLGLRLADTIGTFALQTGNPSKIGKTPVVWQSCYQLVQIANLMAEKH